MTNLSFVILATLVILAIYTIKGIVMIIPAPALYIAVGALFPTPFAIIITYLGMTAALSVAYILGKKLGEKKINLLINKQERVSSFLRTNQDNLLTLCFLSRVLPLPKELFSLFYGSIGMKYPVYLIVSLLGMTPFMIPNVVAGASIHTPLSPEFLIPFGISLGITIVVFVIYTIHTKKMQGLIAY